MNIGCTQMHPVTLAAIIIELVLLGAQLALFLNHPADKNRLWHLLLLLLLIILNITGGLFPDPSFTLPVYIQNIVAYGVGFLVASYFPFYFYKAFELKGLRFHALYGVPLFFVLPYLSFFLVSYSIHEDLEYAQRWGFIIPFFYSLVLLVAILRAIRSAYRENRNRKFYLEEIAVYCAFAPWSLMAVIVYFKLGQLIEVLFTNLGFMAITALLLFRSIRYKRKENALLLALELIPYHQEVVAQNCKRLNMTQRETDIIHLACQRFTYREIGTKLFISERTVNAHIQNIFKKMEITSKPELIRKMNDH